MKTYINLEQEDIKIMEVFELTDSNKTVISQLMSNIDKGVEYPLGDDFFEISHGNNYFSFFEKIGKVTSVLYGDLKNIEGVFTIVERIIDNNKIHYMCDLKKKKNSKNIIMVSMAKYYFEKIYKASDMYYAIHMDKQGEDNNSIVKLLSSYINKYNKKNASKFKQNTKKLNLFSLNYEEILKYKKLIENFKGGFLNINNLTGIKEIILKSTNKPMELIHLEFSDKEEIIGKKYINHTFMFSTLSNSQLSNQLLEKGIQVNATATITNFGMETVDFEFINTGEI